MLRSFFFFSISMIAAVVFGGAQQPASTSPQTPEPPRIHQIQVIGTHNSYHAGLAPFMAQLMEQRAPEHFRTLDYTHPKLAAQFDEGVRQIELDIYADTKGGRYQHPSGPKVAKMLGLAVDPQYLPGEEMSRPGFKVMHVQDIDYRSNCQPFVACLQEIRAWSQEHPTHVPLFILLEAKQSVETKLIPQVVPEKFTTAVLDALDAEIRSVFPPEAMLVPDQVRGSHTTLEEAALAGAWPTVEEARGKVLFLFQTTEVTAPYLEGHPALRGRVIFTASKPGDADAAFVDRSGDDIADVPELVRKGYLVRVRADADTEEARKGDTSRRERAFASGAQFVSTDYPAGEPARWTGYSVALPGGAAARCNPVNYAAACELEKGSGGR